MKEALMIITGLTVGQFIYYSFSDSSLTEAFRNAYFMSIGILVYYFVIKKKLNDD